MLQLLLILLSKFHPFHLWRFYPLSIIYQGVKPLLFNKTFCYQLIPVHVSFQTFRSSRPEVFSELLCEKQAIRNFAEVCNIFLKMRLWCSCFPVNFEKFLRRPFLTEHLVSYIFAKEIHSNLFAYYKKNVFSSVLFLRKLFGSLGLFIISLGNCSVVTGILSPWTHFCKIVVPLFLHLPNHLISKHCHMLKNADLLIYSMYQDDLWS